MVAVWMNNSMVRNCRGGGGHDEMEEVASRGGRGAGGKEDEVERGGESGSESGRGGQEEMTDGEEIGSGGGGVQRARRRNQRETGRADLILGTRTGTMERKQTRRERTRMRKETTRTSLTRWVCCPRAS